MAISSLLVENFKAIHQHLEIELRPLTVFIGANSSGKSTCLHALASLSQSLKLPNNTRALTLDDEFAYVHLGRFIEAMHSRRYKDKISLGVSVDNVPYRKLAYPEKREPTFKRAKGTVKAEFTFQCTLRTQEIYVLNASYALDDGRFEVRKVKDNYVLTYTPTMGKKCVEIPVERSSAFLFSYFPTVRPDKDNSFLYYYLFNDIQQSIADSLRSILYLGPFRMPPLRRYPTRGTGPTEVGPQGESTTTLLANEFVGSQTREHFREISNWLSMIGVGLRVELKRVGRSDLFETTLRLPDGESFPLADLGFGTSQILPVLAQCSFAAPRSTLLFEQPELHLHPKASEALAHVFVDVIKKPCTVILETHSKDLIRGFQHALTEGNIGVNDIAVYKVARAAGSSEVRRIPFEQDGDVYENWEVGI